VTVSCQSEAGHRAFATWRSLDEARSARTDQADGLAGRRTAVVEVRGSRPSGGVRDVSCHPGTVVALNERGRWLAIRIPAKAAVKSPDRIETMVEPYIRADLKEAADLWREDPVKALDSSSVRVRGMRVVVCRIDNLVVAHSCS